MTADKKVEPAPKVSEKVEKVDLITPDGVPPILTPEPEAKKEPKTREYVVTDGAAIAPLGNHKAARVEHGERARLYTSGEVVMLTAKEARHYIDLKRLDPYVPEDE